MGLRTGPGRFSAVARGRLEAAGRQLAGARNRARRIGEWTYEAAAPREPSLPDDPAVLFMSARAVIAKGRLVASGSVDEMRALVARRRISCQTRLSEAEVSAWPGVQEARRERDRLHLAAVDAERVVRRLLDEDPALSRLEVREAGLDDAFNALTKEAA